MKNQVSQLEAAGIAVATLNSTTDRAQKDAIFADLKCGHPRTRLLYITPEYCLTDSFRAALKTVHKQHELARIAIDEAHCISEWGHDFRSAFLHLSYFRDTFPSVPIMCLTATATPTVREDIIRVLNLTPERLKVFTTTVSRPNLHYEVRFTSDEDDTRLDHFLSWLKRVHGRRADDTDRRAELDARNERPDAVSGIIYTSFRSSCDDLARQLQAAGIGAAAYHAGLSTEERIRCQDRWIASAPGYDIIVATTAFGMGIDKEDVRFVVHWNMPKTFEGYYQEAGRAGRDGRASLCLLFYSREDHKRVLSRVSAPGEVRKLPGDRGSQVRQMEMRVKSLKALVGYCEATGRCRHGMVAEYFGEKQEAGICDFTCDFCKEGEGLNKRKEQGLAAEEWVSSQRWVAEGYED